jgi:hypothetical protein
MAYITAGNQLYLSTFGGRSSNSMEIYIYSLNTHTLSSYMYLASVSSGKLYSVQSTDDTKMYLGGYY